MDNTQFLRYEVMPEIQQLDEIQTLPDDHPLPITMSTTYGVSQTLDVAETLVESGFSVIPHVAARMVSSRDELATIHGRVEELDVSSVFVPGGDRQEPAGPYGSSRELLERLTSEFRPSYELGVAGYPEGHEFLDDETVMDALRDKQPFADYIVTNMCFSHERVEQWCNTIRSNDITLPVYCCVPTLIPHETLHTIADTIGVGASAHSIRSGPDGRNADDGRYNPKPLIDNLRSIDAVAGVHISTFNRIAATTQLHETVVQAR